MGVVEVEAIADHLAEIAQKRNEALGYRGVIVGGLIDRRPVIIKLIDGPSGGMFTKVLGFGRVAWQRCEEGLPGGPYWSKYVRSAPGEYTWAADDPDAMIDLVAMADKIAVQGRDRVMGSYGV